MGDPERRFGLSEDAEAFIAGIQKHYSALFHFLTPSPNSLRRIKPSSCVGAYNFWSIENKEAPIRLLLPDKPKALVTNFEIKSFDHTSNHYFALAAAIWLGIRGIKSKMTLPEPFTGDPAKMTEAG